MKTIWILILVKRGIITDPEIFYSATEAQQKKRVLLKNFNRDYDEIKIFKKHLKIK